MLEEIKEGEQTLSGEENQQLYKEEKKYGDEANMNMNEYLALYCIREIGLDQLPE